MDYYLYPNFLSDAGEYAQAEALWREQWEELRAHVKNRDTWRTPWLSTSFADGAPCRDGNPIFSAVSATDRRGIRVVQLPPSANPRELQFRVETFDEGGPDQIDELVICCALTRGTLIDSMSVMSQWVEEGRIDVALVDSDSEATT